MSSILRIVNVIPSDHSTSLRAIEDGAAITGGYDNITPSLLRLPRHLRWLAMTFLLILVPFPVLADISKEKLPLPRFVTIKFDEVNARTGPAVDCPIEWVFIRKGEPVEIVAEYEQWRKIRDVNGEGGWIHSSALSAKRSVILVAKNIMPLIGAPGNYDDIIAKLKPKLRCNLVKCKEEWCQIVCKSYKGWMSRKFLWGVYPDE